MMNTTAGNARRNPLDDWQVERACIQHVGQDLRRPECILAERNGSLWTADARGGVMHIHADGQQTLVAQTDVDQTGTGTQHPGHAAGADLGKQYILAGTLPNGLAFARNGDILIANFGTDAIECMQRNGQSTTLYTHIDGQPLGKTNFILRDSRNRIWFTVTTRVKPWTRAAVERIADGYIGVIDERGIRIVADGFIGTNEIRFDAREQWLYVVESNARRISRLRVHDDARLSHREVFGPSDLGGVPDGFAFDAFGNLWITLVIYDRLIALTPQGDVRLLLDDGGPVNAALLDAQHQAGTFNPANFTHLGGRLAPWMASLTFGGPDLRTVYLGSLMGTTLPCFQSPVPGLPLVHWHESTRNP